MKTKWSLFSSGWEKDWQCYYLQWCKSQPHTAKYHLFKMWVASLHSLGWLLPEKLKITSVGEDAEKLENSCSANWECKMVQLLGKRVWSFLKILSIKLPYDSAILFPKYVLQAIENRDSSRSFYTNWATFECVLLLLFINSSFLRMIYFSCHRAFRM